MEQETLKMTCAKPNARPVKVTDEMARRAAENIAEELTKFGDFGPDDKSGIVNDVLSVAKYNYWMDGYEMARELERTRYWSPDANTVETLNYFGRNCASELALAEKTWGVENPMEPPFPVGTAVIVQGQDGTIKEIYLHGPAKYIVHIPVVPGHLRIVNFEDIIAKEPTP